MNELTRLFGLEALGRRVDPEEYIRWAQAELDKGKDISSLRVLAGLGIPGPPDSSEVRKYFERSLAKLSIAVPARKQAVDAYANMIVGDILNGQIDPREALDVMKAFYGATGCKEFKFHGWELLSSVVWVHENEENEKRSTAEVNELIAEEAKLFKEFQELTLPERFKEMVFCTQCDFFGLPIKKRVHLSWLPKLVYKFAFGRWPCAAEVCPQCKCWRLTNAYLQTGRRQYLERTAGVANNPVQAISPAP